jgi:nitroreductase
MAGQEQSPLQERDRRSESGSLQRRVCKLSVPAIVAEGIGPLPQLQQRAKVGSDGLSWRIELPERTAETTDIFEIMHTMRAMRRLKPDPVPDELIRKILLAGQAAANGGNTQRWRFLVLKNHPGKKVVQGYYKKLFDEVVGPRYRNSAPPPGSDQPKQLRQMAANQYLTDHYHEAPVWIVACLEGDNPGYSSGASIYPAVENMLLAARALGLGSTLTTRHIGYAKECDEAMGIPPNYHSYAILPIGYPMGRFGPIGRGPLSEVVYLDGWGKPYPEIWSIRFRGEGKGNSR